MSDAPRQHPASNPEGPDSTPEPALAEPENDALIEGRITSYDPSSRTGQINDADDNEYRFTKADWQSPGKPGQGLHVRFMAEDGKAVQIETLGTPAAPSAGSSRGGWVALLLGGLFMFIAIGLANAMQPGMGPEHALMNMQSAIGGMMFVTVNLTLATRNIVISPRGRIVGWLALVLNTMVWLTFAGLALEYAYFAAGVPLNTG